MDDSLLVGLAVSSAPNDAEATFDRVTWTAGEAPSSSHEESQEPERPFLESTRNAPLGRRPVKGRVEIRGGFVTIRPGEPGDKWGTTDEGKFVYRELKGGGGIVARLKSFRPADTSDRAGLMMREWRTRTPRAWR